MQITIYGPIHLREAPWPCAQSSHVHDKFEALHASKAMPWRTRYAHFDIEKTTGSQSVVLLSPSLLE